MAGPDQLEFRGRTPRKHRPTIRDVHAMEELIQIGQFKPSGDKLGVLMSGAWRPESTPHTLSVPAFPQNAGEAALRHTVIAAYLRAGWPYEKIVELFGIPENPPKLVR